MWRPKFFLNVVVLVVKDVEQSAASVSAQMSCVIRVVILASRVQTKLSKKKVESKCGCQEFVKCSCSCSDR